MSILFHAQPEPTKELCEVMTALAPTNPFYGFSYIQAKRMLGFQPWVLSLLHDDRIISACSAFVKSGYLNRSLEITSLPSLPDNDIFWKGLLEFCRNAHVSYLEVNSFGSSQAIIPLLAREVDRTARYEYIVELQGYDLWNRLALNHRRNIKHAKKCGVAIRCLTDEQACYDHALLIRASMDRRKGRGEEVADEIQARLYSALIQSGAGKLFQAVQEDRILSSILIIPAEQGAYYQSAGTSPAGMSKGASHLLVYEVATTLKDQGREMFNLGGADQLNAGLQRFKTGFGAREVRLESAGFFLGSKSRAQLSKASKLMRESISYLLRRRGQAA